jgi:hypothetical protein
LDIITPGPDGSVTVGQAAQLCGVSVITIRSWINRGYVSDDGSRVKLPVKHRWRGIIHLDPVEVQKAEYATARRTRRKPAA